MPPAGKSGAGMTRDEDECAKYASDPLVYHGNVKRELLVAELVALDRFCEDITKIKIPTLFMHGML